MDKRRSPWYFIPTQYFAEGIPYIVVNQLSAALYKSLGASNSFIGATSFLYLPWSLKPLWSPALDANSTKRSWHIYMQLAMGLLFLALAGFVHLEQFLIISLVLFGATAFLSATHDIATDGYYLHVLDKGEQAFFTGIRSTFYRLAMIFSGGVLVTLAGGIGNSTGNIAMGWSIAFAICGLLFLLLFGYHKVVLPYPLSDAPVRDVHSKIPFAKVFKLYFTQKNIGVIVVFILVYRLGEGLLLKMAQPFLLDEYAKGGLGLHLEHIGIMYGTIGVVALVVGGIIGGIILKKYSLKHWMLPLSFAMNLPNLLYFILATNPTYFYELSGVQLFGWNIQIQLWTQIFIVIEQFGYGLGFTGFMVYLLHVSQGEFRTSFYAISTGLMALGMMIPGLISGYLQESVGYSTLFLLSFIFTIPGMVLIKFLKFE